jgi:hypothetical protein
MTLPPNAIAQRTPSRIALSVMLFMLCFTYGLLADTKGKIAGRVTTKDKEPVVGAHVVLVGTTFGAATDIDGNYYILNITPGICELRISSVGYGAQLFKEVRISSGQTTTVDAVLAKRPCRLERWW